MKINKFLTLLILLVIVVSVALFTAIGTYANDDWWAAFFWSKNIIRTIVSSDQGLVISWQVQRIFAHAIPTLLKIHPQQNIILAVVKGINFALYIGLLSAYFNLAKKKMPNFIVVIINTLLIFGIIFFVDVCQLVYVNQHFKYLFNLIIGATIWYIWFNEFINDKFLLKENIIRDCFFTIILVFTGHLVSIPSAIVFLCLFTYLIAKSNKQTDKIKSLLKLFTPLAIIYVTCFLVDINLPGFTYIRAYRIPQNSVLYYSLTHFIYFTKSLFLYIINKKAFCGLFLATIIGFIGLIINRKKIDSKYFVIAGGIFLGNFAFIYSLLTCGTTFYDHKSYWFVSPQLTATFMFYLIMVCNVIYGNLFNIINKTAWKVCLTILCIFLVSIVLFPINIGYNKAIEVYEKEKIQQTAIYKLSKFYRYYALTNDTIYVPEQYYKDINKFWIQPVWKSLNNNMTLVYHIDKNKKFEKIDRKIINEYELFTRKELKHINFKRLYDDKFILQMKEPKYE